MGGRGASREGSGSHKGSTLSTVTLQRYKETILQRTHLWSFLSWTRTGEGIRELTYLLTYLHHTHGLTRPGTYSHSRRDPKSKEAEEGSGVGGRRWVGVVGSTTLYPFTERRSWTLPTTSSGGRTSVGSVGSVGSAQGRWVCRGGGPGRDGSGRVHGLHLGGQGCRGVAGRYPPDSGTRAMPEDQHRVNDRDPEPRHHKVRDLPGGRTSEVRLESRLDRRKVRLVSRTDGGPRDLLDDP